MSRDQQRTVWPAKKRGLSWLGWTGAITFVIVGICASTCTNSNIVITECSEQSDCDKLPGTICIEPFCTCPHNGEGWCAGACRTLEECKQVKGATGAGGAGGTGGAGGAGGAGGSGGNQ